MDTAEFNQTEETSNPRERVVADLKALMSDAEELLKATAGDLSEKAREARTKLNSAIARARESARPWEAKATAGVKATDQMIRKHPYESLGVAFGIGVLLGVLLNRR
jgi:ElaB/YqjD/DUF883 family membrane-anchored ribosome-binding protein